MTKRFLPLLALAATLVALLGSASASSIVTATFVHPSLAGEPTVCNTLWSNTEMIVASPTHRCGTRLRLTNTRTGATVNVTVRDRLPYLALSRNAFSHLAPTSQGLVRVRVDRQ